MITFALNCVPAIYVTVSRAIYVLTLTQSRSGILKAAFTVLLVVLALLPNIGALTHTFPLPKTLAQSPPSGPVLDGTGTAMGQCGSQGGYVCELLTTTQTNDVVMAIATCENDYGIQYYCDQDPNSVKDTSGLSFSLHGSYCYNNTTVGRSSCVWDYYAVAPFALNNDNLTGYFNPTLMHRLFAFAVSGADMNDIFDPDLPQGRHCPYMDQQSPYTCTLNFTTSQTASSSEFLFVTIPDDDAPTCSEAGIPPSQGWFLIQSDGGNTEIDYQVADVLNQQSVALTCPSNSDPLVEVADGIRGPVDTSVGGSLVPVNKLMLIVRYVILGLAVAPVIVLATVVNRRSKKSKEYLDT